MKGICLSFLLLIMFSHNVNAAEYAGLYSPYSEPMGNLRVCFIKNDGEIPTDFMRRCIGEGAMPYIVIEGEKAIFDTKYSERLARELGYFDTEAIVELYPLKDEPEFNAAAYRRFFAQSKEIFDRFAPKSKFVWAVTSEMIYNEWEFYPGDAYIDYIGISLIYGLNGDYSELYREDKLDYISYAYPKPVFIARYSAVAYSEKGHKYFRNEKADCARLEKEAEERLNACGIIFYEAESYEREGYKNKLRMSDNEEAFSAVRSAIKNVLKE